MQGRRAPTQFGFDNLPPQVPPTRFSAELRAINELVDFEPFRQLCAPAFAAGGRPSLDPVLMIKMMVVGALFGILSDRRLVDECADRASVREFLGLGWGDALPVHASFTHWRQRLGQGFFHQALEAVVTQCQTHGMTLSLARTVDATTVKAQADKHGPTRSVPSGEDVNEFLDQYFAQDLAEAPGGGAGAVLGSVPPPDESEGAAADAPAPGAASAEGQRGQDRTILINTHDPDARLQRKTHEIAQFRYNVSFYTDVRSGLILGAFASAFERASDALAHVWRDPRPVRELAADGLYDSGELQEALQDLGVTCYMPAPRAPVGAKLDRSQFEYDPERNVYTCPQGATLTQSRYDQKRGQRHYTARVSDCRECPLKAQCTDAKRRSLSRMDSAAARAKTVRAGARYEQLQRQRRINEHLNLLAKRDHGMARARSLGLEAMNIQACVTAMAIDLKLLVRFKRGASGGAGRQRVGVAAAGARGAAGLGLLAALWRRRRRPSAYRRP